MMVKKVLFVVVVFTVFASFCLAEEISVPAVAKITASPAAAGRVNGGRVEIFVAAAVSSEGHALEYQFNWGDGNVGQWGAATQTHVYTYFAATTYPVTVQARCIADGTTSDISAALVVTTECVKSNASFYVDWSTFNRPDCWCCSRNCRGDADCRCVGFGVNRQCVNSRDLAIVAAAFNKTQAILQGCYYEDVPCICGDNNRLTTGMGVNRQWVNGADLSILSLYFNKTLASVPICPQTNYHYWTD